MARLFIDAVIFPDLHRIMTARAGIAITSDDDVFPSLPLRPQSHPPTKKKRTALLNESVR